MGTGVVTSTSVGNLGFTVTIGGHQYTNNYSITDYFIENGKIIVKRSFNTNIKILYGSVELPNGVYTSAVYSEGTIYNTADNYATTVTITDDCYIVDFVNASAQTITEYNGYYEFDVKDSNYYSLFGFENKQYSKELINGYNIFTFEQGNISQETTFSESYIDIESTWKPKIYKVLITQSSEDAPTLIVLENTLGTIYAIRNEMGVCVLQSTSDLFTADKTFITPTSYIELKAETYQSVKVSYTDVNNITIYTYDNTSTADNILVNFPLTIEVYP